ncbi:hypothetical protein ACWGF2_38980 [Streptomyces sp. NPDC054919]
MLVSTGLPKPFQPLLAGRRLATVNTVLVVVAAAPLFAMFTPLGEGAVPVLSVVAGTTSVSGMMSPGPEAPTDR